MRPSNRMSALDSIRDIVGQVKTNFKNENGRKLPRFATVFAYTIVTPLVVGSRILEKLTYKLDNATKSLQQR